MDVLQNLDANQVYGRPIRRRDLGDFDELYRGTPCERADLNQALRSGEMFFAAKLDVSKEEGMAELVQREIRKALQENQREMMERFVERSEMEVFVEERLDERLKEDKEQRVKEMHEYVKLETTPLMICWGVIGALQKKVQEEFRRSARYACSQPEFAQGLQELKELLRERSSPESWTIDEVCYKFCKMKKASAGCNPAAVELLNFLVNSAMSPIVAGSPSSTLDDNPAWIDEWASYKAMEYRRHQGGHPDVPHEHETEAEARVARVRSLYKAIVDNPGFGCGIYNDLGVTGFHNLARAALREPSTSGKLAPYNVWIGAGEVHRVDLGALLSPGFQSCSRPGFQSSSRSYLLVEDLWLADFAVINESSSWREEIKSCFAKGVEKIVALTQSDEDEKLLKSIRKCNRCVIHICSTKNEDAAELRESVIKALDLLTPARPAGNKLFLMVALEVEVDEKTSSVRVEGRVERGSIGKGMGVVFEGLQASKLKVEEVEVQHLDAQPVPGARVTLKLSGALSILFSTGQFVADFRDAESSRTELRARVLNVSAAKFVSGSYTLQCSRSCFLFNVEVQLEARLVEEGATKKKKQRRFSQRLVAIDSEALQKGEAGRVRITSPTPMPLVPPLMKTNTGGNYCCSRFVIIAEVNGPVLLAGQACGG